jgi:branched-chain amino acid transport system ATP-binding protein
MTEATGEVIRVTDLMVRYGAGVEAVRGVSLTVSSGQFVVLLGSNGAGKSSIVRAVTGFLREPVHLSGSVCVLGADVLGATPHAIARRGLASVQEREKIFANLTVGENLDVAGLVGTWSASSVAKLFPQLGSRMRDQAGLLSGGQRQMLALSMALVRRPSVIVIDELSLGLSPAVTVDLYRTLRSLAAEGMAFLVVEQMARTVLPIADQVHVLSAGRLVLSGGPNELSLTDITDAYLSTASPR